MTSLAGAPAVEEREPGTEITFSVDSALLRELGERLVGQPHIALAELIKNSYDADATEVTIEFSADQIVITDNGHGMDYAAFRDRWMRVGTPGKQSDRWSPRFGRPLTGSKGVGRLSVQFLASELELRTVSEETCDKELMAMIDWGTAVKAGELTQAVALYDIYPAAAPFDGLASGTRISLTGLTQRWDAQGFEDLAKQIWPLQPPFWGPEGRRPGEPVQTRDTQFRDTFLVRVASTEDPDIVWRFNRQMQRVLDIHQARLTGRLIRRESEAVAEIVLQFNDGSRHTAEFPPSGDYLDKMDFEIRVFELHNRQPYGIKVDEAREYLHRNGGVHVYDAGFNLPYYGPDTDWLGIDADHAARRSRSQLLPDSLQVEGGMEYLPPNGRMFGVVNVDTSHERDHGRGDQADHLAIQVSRDRLVDNASLRELATIVRWALDFYATRQTSRQFAERIRKRPVASTAQRSVNAIVDKVKDRLDESTAETLRGDIEALVAEVRSESQELEMHAGLLGALATAGMAALALEHEISKQFSLLEGLVTRLETGMATDLPVVAGGVREWISRARASQRLFAHLVSRDEREERRRYSARTVVQTVVDQTKPLMRGVDVNYDNVLADLLLPDGRLSEWTAILQNVLFNAHDATLDSADRLVRLRVRLGGVGSALIVEDTGAGVDLQGSGALFNPFVQALDISPGRRTLRIGSSGLGLTIVRMVCRSLNCRARFVVPADGFATALEISWTET